MISLVLVNGEAFVGEVVRQLSFNLTIFFLEALVGSAPCGRLRRFSWRPFRFQPGIGPPEIEYFSACFV